LPIQTKPTCYIHLYRSSIGRLSLKSSLLCRLIEALVFVMLFLSTLSAIDPSLPPTRASQKRSHPLLTVHEIEFAHTPQQNFPPAFLRPTEHASRTSQSKAQILSPKSSGLSRRGRSRRAVVLPHRLWRCYGKLSTSAFRTPGARSRSQISAGTSQTYPLMVTSMMRCGMRESQLPLVLQRSQLFNSNTTVLLPECAEEVGSSRGQQALTKGIVVFGDCRSMSITG